jgi:ribosomal protein L37E
MDAQTFDRTNELSAKLIQEMGKLQQQGHLESLTSKVQDLLKQLPDGCSITLNFSVEVFDSNRDRTLKAGTTGVTFEKGQQPYLVDLGLSPTKYLVDGVMMKVPHDQCPNCWSRWPLKSRVKSCPECGYSMGREVKLLVDTNLCPRCEEGPISLHQPQCNHCGFVAEKNLVVWG